jgi:hypothetical protein
MSWHDLLPAHLGDIREIKEQLMNQQTQIDGIVTERKATKVAVDTRPIVAALSSASDSPARPQLWFSI